MNGQTCDSNTMLQLLVIKFQFNFFNIFVFSCYHFFVCCDSKSNCGQSGLFDRLDVTSHADIKIKFNTIGIGSAFESTSIVDWLYKLDSGFVRFNFLWIFYRSAWIEKGSSIFGRTTCCLLAIDLFRNNILLYFDCSICKRINCWWCSCHRNFIRNGN